MIIQQHDTVRKLLVESDLIGKQCVRWVFLLVGGMVRLGEDRRSQIFGDEFAAGRLVSLEQNQT